MVLLLLWFLGVVFFFLHYLFAVGVAVVDDDALALILVSAYHPPGLNPPACNTGSASPFLVVVRRAISSSYQSTAFADFIDRKKREDGDDQDQDEEEEEDPDITEEEMARAKTMLKDKVKDQTQVLLDEARDSVNDTVSFFFFLFFLFFVWWF